VAGNWWRVCEGKFVGFLGIAVDSVLKRGETISFYVLKRATEMLFSRHVCALCAAATGREDLAKSWTAKSLGRSP
jgi:hypothetical protein